MTQKSIYGLLLTTVLWASSALAETVSTRAMLVLDASGSMAARIDGQVKMDGARDVIGGLLKDWNANLALGLIAYGHRRKGDCSDIETLLPVGPVDAEQLRGIVNGLRTIGRTPLSAAVRQAAEALRYTEDQATVIVVSDGKESCDLDPCQVGAELEQTGVDFTAHVIGFDITAEERAGLECLAAETGGQYFDAQRAEELQAALGAVVEQVQIAAAVQPQEPEPEPETQLQPEPQQAEVELSAVDTAPMNNEIEIGWQGRSDDKDFITVVTPDTADNQYQGYAYTKKGNPVTLLMPDSPGIYELRYIAGKSRQVLARWPIEITEVATRISASEVANIGNTIEIAWSGPGHKSDLITVVAPDAADNTVGQHSYLRDGSSPVSLTVPETAGVYELRYLSGQRRVLARVPIEVRDVESVLNAVEQAGIGGTIEVTWSGPNNPRDYITIVAPDAADSKTGRAYAYTSKGSPAVLQLPDQPGVYELRYVTAKDRRVLSRRVVEVVDVSAELLAPDSAAAGSMLSIDWNGPNNKRDYITVVAPDAGDSKTGKAYAYTSKGSPASLQLPDQPGVYELRYVSAQSRRVLARRVIEVSEVSAVLNALDIVAIGKPLQVWWSGPNNRRDYIALAAPGSADDKYLAYKYTNDGTPVKIKLPQQTGIYELRYVSGQSKTVLARRSLELIAADQLQPRYSSEAEGQLTLRAVDLEGSDVEDDLSWTIYGVLGIDKSIHRSSEPQPQLSLPMGIYRVGLRAGGASASQDVVLNPGSEVELSLPLVR